MRVVMSPAWVYQPFPYVAALFSVWFCISRTFFGLLYAVISGGTWYLYGWPLMYAESWQGNNPYLGNEYERWPIWAAGELKVRWDFVLVDACVVCIVLIAVAVRLQRKYGIALAMTEGVLIVLVGGFILGDLGAINIYSYWNLLYESGLGICYSAYTVMTLFPWIKGGSGGPLVLKQDTCSRNGNRWPHGTVEPN